MCELIYLEEGWIDDVSICQDATPATALRELAQRVCVFVFVWRTRKGGIIKSRLA